MPRRGLRALLLTLVVVLAALAGAWVAVRAAGPITAASAVGDVRVEAGLAAPGRRGLELYVPLADWGLRADVTRAPLLVSLEPRRIDRRRLVALATNRGTDPVPLLRRQLDAGIRRAVRRAALLALLGALGGGLVAALVWRLAGVGRARLVLAPVGAVALVAALGGGTAAWAAATWDPERLERPDYYASGAELERILDQAGRLRVTGARYRDRVDLSIRTIAGLLDDRSPVPGLAGPRLTVASDVHANLLPLPTLRRFAAGGPVALTGDFAVNGSRIEAGLLRGLRTLGEPVVAVSGNHDSPGLMRRLARSGILVLTHEGALGADGRRRGPAVREVAGLRMAGFEDPLEYPGTFPRGIRTALSFGDLPDGRERYQAAVEERWGWWRALGERPQVLLVHQESLGRALAARIAEQDPQGAPLTIVVGHTHRQRMDRYGPVTVVNSGSAGAGGVFGAGRDRLGIARLELSAAGALDATDLVQVDPATTAASARRVITARPDCDEELVFCHEPGDAAPPESAEPEEEPASAE